MNEIKLFLNGYLQGIFPRTNFGLYNAKFSAFTISNAILLGQGQETNFDSQNLQNYINSLSNNCFNLDLFQPIFIENVGSFYLI